jgi:hypothetical protein
MKLSSVSVIADKLKEVVIAWSHDSDCGLIERIWLRRPGKVGQVNSAEKDYMLNYVYERYM